MTFRRQPMMLLLLIIYAANINAATNVMNPLQQETNKYINKYEKDCESYNLAYKRLIEAESNYYDHQFLNNKLYKELSDIREMKGNFTEEHWQRRDEMRRNIWELERIRMYEQETFEKIETDFRAISIPNENCSNTKLFELIKECKDGFLRVKLESRELNGLQHMIKCFDPKTRVGDEFYLNLKRQEFANRMEKLEVDVITFENESKALDGKLYKLKTNVEEPDMIVLA